MQPLSHLTALQLARLPALCFKNWPGLSGVRSALWHGNLHEAWIMAADHVPKAH